MNLSSSQTQGSTLGNGSVPVFQESSDAGEIAAGVSR
jgi:hypothetical protein